MSKKCAQYYLPVSPWDMVGPSCRAGLSQTCIGGPLVVRSNPVGALFDAVKRFCSPLPQTEDGDGGFLAEDPAYSTPEYSTFDDQPLDSGWFPQANFGPPGPATGGYGGCGPGTIWDGGMSACVPEKPKADPAGIEAASAARARLSAAISAKDCEGVRQVLDLARASRGAKGTAASLRWNPIAVMAWNWLGANKRKCGAP